MIGLVRFLPYLAVVAGVIGLYIYGFNAGKGAERLKWQVAQTKLLKAKAKATQERDAALVKIDAAEVEIAEKQRLLDEAERQEIDDAIGKSIVDSTFDVDCDTGRLFDRSVGLASNAGTGSNSEPCKEAVRSVPGSPKPSEGG